MTLLFKIISIDCGWFEVDINKKFILTNSIYLSCDAPALLLETLCNLMEDKIAKEWLCWQDEPSASILQLGKIDGQLVVEIYDTEKESFDLAHSGVTLNEYITTCLYSTKDCIEKAAKNILMEFELYESGIGRERYIENWSEFPKQYYRLEKLLM